jgi:periplasmic protein TonB
MSGMGRAFIVSLLVHGLLVALVYAIPSDRDTGPRTLSADFTLVEYVDMRAMAGAGTAPIGVGMSADRKSARKAADAPRSGDSQNAAEERAPVQADQGVSRTISLTSAAGEGQPVSSDGVPVTGPARSDGTGGAGGLSSGRRMLGSLDPGWAEASGGNSGDGGSPAALRRMRDEIMKNVTYPERARRMGWEGRVILSFMVYEDGSVHDERILQSSGVSMLDEAAREALRKSVLKSQVGKRVHVVLPIEYRLR